MPGPEEQRESEKRLVLAREIGQVRDAIGHTGSGSAASVLEHYPTVRAAVAAGPGRLKPRGAQRKIGLRSRERT